MAVAQRQQQVEPICLTDIPWQDTPDGFIYSGMGAPYAPWRAWENYLYLAVFGGRFAGKSFAGALRHFLFCNAHPHSTNIIAFPDYHTWNIGTFPALKKVFRKQGLIEGVHWTYNVTNKTLYYTWCDVTVYCISLDDEKGGRSARAASVWIDEAGFITFKAFTGLQPTMTEEGFPHQCWMTSTPVGKQHWTYQFFEPALSYEEGYSDRDLSKELEDLDGIQDGRRHYFFAATAENPHGGVREDLEMARIYGRDSKEYQQEARGRFVVSEGLTYAAWNTEFHALPRSAWPGKERQNPKWRPSHVCMGGDFGEDHAATWTVGGIDTDGREYVLEVWKKRQAGPVEMRKEGIRLATKWGAQYGFTDHDPTWRRVIYPAELELIEDGRIVKSRWPEGCYLKPANKYVGSSADPSGGIGLIHATLRARHKDGGPMYIVDRDMCAPLVREYENYQRPGTVEGKPSPERPLHVGDDLMDAERYRKTMQSLWLKWDRQENRQAAARVSRMEF